MKTKYTMLAVALAVTVTATAQEVDDMYFTAKDRVVLAESNQADMASRYAAYDQQAVRSNPVNPSDSYTGRGVNPEFSAQQKNGAEIIQGNPDYFLSSYAPKDVNANLYSGNSTYSGCGCNTGSPYSTMPYSGFGNPYGNFYSPYGNGFSPYTSMGYGYNGYSSMLSMSIGYGMGMGSMYGPYGYGMGMGSMYNPYGYGGMYNPYGYGYAPVVVGGMDAYPTTSYGQRSVRGGSVSTQPYYTGSSSGNGLGTNGRTRATASGTNYYDPSWKSDPNNFPTRSSFNMGGRSAGYSSPSSTGRTWGYDTGPSRSYDSFGSGGSRSSIGAGSMSGGGSGGGGRTRGRN